MLLYRELSTENDECMFLVYLLICMHQQSIIGGFFLSKFCYFFQICMSVI